MQTRHNELELYDDHRAALQRILADQITVDSAVRVRGMKAVRLNAAANVYGFFTEDGEQVETLNVRAVRTVSELDDILDDIADDVQAAEQERGIDE
jgi:hypothetical protein